MSIPVDRWSDFLPNIEIESLIAEGSFGTVYRATQVKLDRPVAIKVISGDEDQLAPLMDEAKRMVQLEDENVVRVFDFGIQDGLLYLVTELVSGGTLRDQIDAGITENQALRLFFQAAGGVARAHQEGVVHVDLKPENILIAEDGSVKVADFGLKHIYAGIFPDQGSKSTADYTAPERFDPDVESIDHRVDIYSLGIVLYEMLVGKRPDLDNYEPPSSLVGTNPEVDRVIEKCLQAQPDARFSSVVSVLKRLKPLLVAKKKKSAEANSPGGKMGGETTAVQTKFGAAQSVSSVASAQSADLKERKKSGVDSRLSAGTDDSVKALKRSREKMEKAEKEAKTMRKGILWATLFLIGVAGVIAFLVVDRSNKVDAAKKAEIVAEKKIEADILAAEEAEAARLAAEEEARNAPTPEEIAIAEEAARRKAAIDAFRPAIVPKSAYSTHRLPGIFQGEDYDKGGPDVSYKDNTPLNLGNYKDGVIYRTNESPDLWTADEAAGGIYLGDFSEGEWVDYTIKQIRGGSYTVDIQYSSDSEEPATLEFELDGGGFLSTRLQPTGDRNKFTIQSIDGINMEASQGKVIRVHCRSGVVNIDEITFVIRE